MTIAEGEENAYRVEPAYANKFKEKEARDIVQRALKEKLSGATYHPDNTSTWAKEIADDIKQELKEKDWARYKYVVHVVIGEQKGEGLKVACRCFWDANTDAFAKDTFENKSLFAVATVYGVYFY
jgi:tctex1 domain-containing protein 2